MITGNEALTRMARGLALDGSHRVRSASRKYALTTAATSILLPVWNEKMPTHIKFSIPAGAAVYGSFDELLAASVPTTTADGSEKLDDGQVVSIWTANRMSLVAESVATVTVSFYWT